jgi:hypothetical protein
MEWRPCFIVETQAGRLFQRFSTNGQKKLH